MKVDDIAAAQVLANKYRVLSSYYSQLSNAELASIAPGIVIPAPRVQTFVQGEIDLAVSELEAMGLELSEDMTAWKQQSAMMKAVTP